MTKATRWGILSAGLISHDFTNALTTLNPEEHVIAAVAARNGKSAADFAEKFGIPKSYEGTYLMLHFYEVLLIRVHLK